MFNRYFTSGGYAFVFIAQDLQNGKDFALKRLIAADADAVKSVIQEIAYLKQLLAGHPHIINFISACCNERPGGSKEYLVVTELCSGKLKLIKSS